MRCAPFRRVRRRRPSAAWSRLAAFRGRRAGGLGRHDFRIVLAAVEQYVDGRVEPAHGFARPRGRPRCSRPAAPARFRGALRSAPRRRLCRLHGRLALAAQRAAASRRPWRSRWHDRRPRTHPSWQSRSPTRANARCAPPRMSNSISSVPAIDTRAGLDVRDETCPFSSTVSMPMCSRTSAPCGVVIVTAWPVRARCDTTPTGTTSWPASGSMPMPSPNIPPENTGSGTSASATIGPVMGLSRTI